MPARLWRFMGTVDTGAGNGDAVYRDLVVVLRVLNRDVRLVGRYYYGVIVITGSMFHCSSLGCFCVVIMIMKMFDGYVWCSKFHPEAPLTLEPAGMTLKFGMSVQSNQLESTQDIGDTPSIGFPARLRGGALILGHNQSGLRF